MSTRTRPVAAGLTATVASLLAGCAHTQTADCVNAQGQVLPDAACRGGYVPVGAGFVGAHYVYGGRLLRSGSISRISGGSLTPSSTESVSTRSGTSIISRGGFGESAGFHGGGGFGE